MVESTQPQNQPQNQLLAPPENYDVGSVDIFNDPSYVENIFLIELLELFMMHLMTILFKNSIQLHQPNTRVMTMVKK